MRPKNVGTASKIGNCPRDAQDAVHRACGQLKQVDRVLQHRLIVRCEPADGIRLRLVEPGIDATGALLLPRPRLHHALAHGVAGFAGRCVGAQFRRRQSRDFEMQVDAFEQRAGDLAAVAQDRFRMTAASSRRIACPATRA
jgi:hypothetical protein